MNMRAFSGLANTYNEPSYPTLNLVELMPYQNQKKRQLSLRQTWRIFARLLSALILKDNGLEWGTESMKNADVSNVNA